MAIHTILEVAVDKEFSRALVNFMTTE